MADKRYIRIITDSGCDLPERMEEEYGIDIMPFEITLDDLSFWERFDMSQREFYKLMNNSQSIPKTNQIVTPRFEEKMRQLKKEGVKNALFVLINSRGSKTYENAVMARKNLSESGELGDMNVYIADSRTYSLGYGYPVIEAAKKFNAGQTVEAVLAYLEDWFECAEVYIVPFNLRHMKKSGRITAASAFLGELMGIKPVVQLIDGVSEVVKKARGERAVIEEAARFVKGRIVPQTPYVTLSADEPELYDLFLRRIMHELGYAPAMQSLVGCAVGINTGPKMAAVILKGAPRGKMVD